MGVSNENANDSHDSCLLMFTRRSCPELAPVGSLPRICVSDVHTASIFLV